MKKLLIAAVALTALAVPASAGGFNCTTNGVFTNCQEDGATQFSNGMNDLARGLNERRARKAAAKEELFWIKSKGGMPANMVEEYCDMHADKYGKLLTRSSYFKNCLAALK